MFRPHKYITHIYETTGQAHLTSGLDLCYNTLMKTTTPRSEIMAEPPVETTQPDYLEPTLQVEFMTIENSAELIEHELVRTLLDVMSFAKRDADKLAAVKEAGDLLGKKAKQPVNLITADNVQVNQLAANPELQRNLLESAKGLASVAAAKDSGIKSKFGGSGV